MRIILIIFMLLPVFTIGQQANIYVKLTDQKGVPIRGDVVLKGYEKWIGATSFTSSGRNNTLLSFSMPVCGASADFKRAESNGSILLYGQVTVLSPNQTLGAPQILYTIKMEGISVLSCTESMGCNNILNTVVSLQATRIGWTHYDASRTGVQTVVRKYGWDSATNAEWTGF